jgi:hypothetical protein
VAVSLYRASVPVYIRGLTNLAGFLDKAEAFLAAEGGAADDLIQARLIADMHPLARQIQSVSDTAKGGGARLSGTEIPSFADEETTFAELRERIAKTIRFLEGITPASIDETGPDRVTLKLGPKQVEFTAEDFLFTFSLPNFFFHVTTAYAILRHKGVPLGKMTYLGPFASIDAAE